jgi:putative addiction module component (TIGR02574 family)
MSKFSVADVLELPLQERLQLVEDIWDTIADAPHALDLTEEDKRIIDERLKARTRDAKAGAPWADVYADVYARVTSRTR